MRHIQPFRKDLESYSNDQRGVVLYSLELTKLNLGPVNQSTVKNVARDKTDISEFHSVQ